MTTAPPAPPRPDTLVTLPAPPAPPAARTGPGRLRTFGRAPRVVALDIARGIAVLGMAAAHTAALPGALRWDEPATWVDLVNGRSSILFAVLAGISIAIMTGRTRIPTGAELGHARLRLVARGLVIFAIGLVLELLGTSIAVILTFYGAVYAVAVLFVGMRVSRVLLWAAALAVAGPALVAGLMALALWSSGSGVGFVLEGTYSIVVWTALMLAGLAVGRLDVTRKRTMALTLAVGTVLSAVGYTAGALWAGDPYDVEGSWYSSSGAESSVVDDGSWPVLIPGDEADLTGMVCEDYGDGYLSCYPEDDGADLSGDDLAIEEDGNGWATYPDAVATADVGGTMLGAFLSSYPHSGGTMEILGSGGLALALVGLLLLTGEALRYVLLPLAAVGSMPLTAYTAHVVAIWMVMGPGGWSQPPELFWFLAAGLLLGCTLWAVLLGRGPLERLTARASDRLAPRPR
ncbi:heparan-alpha-glucosaminide N-acetyltransferase domain-containing protein [Georgenia satyanarayanai]|uniref:heparan-alpha-glucosaminide N-acetyltransferase domain-containing protein n=1 Tax=Georgenia satyanarayanai TaxID=860221 RepID=UPI0012640326|nr:heparan-alpha-glucosaminide N-acetyltransferase domain-containing protein [Georgenia satyanarayanai]